MKEKKIWSKCYLTISNILKKLVWLLSSWTEYGNNDQLFVFQESKFNVYLCNLRWDHDRFQILRRCYGGILNFPALKIWEIHPLSTCYLNADFQTCSICRTTELEIPIPIFLHYCYKLPLKLPQKQIPITLLWLNLKKREFNILEVKFLKLKSMKFIFCQNVLIFPKPT